MVVIFDIDRKIDDMTITIKAKVDVDVKNVVCQHISHYCTVLNQVLNILSPVIANVGQKEVHNVGESFCPSIKKKCDSLNDILGYITQSLDDRRLPKEEQQKRIIFSWYDSCKSWIHDSRGFIQTIYTIIRGYKGGNVHDKDVHSIYALHSALLTLVIRQRAEILGVEPDYENTECEIYKIFDKIRRCYRTEEDCFNWRIIGNCYRKVICTKGFDVVPLNLYANALKYLPEGDANSSKRNIAVSFSEDDNGISISVASIGPFVDKDEIAKVWDIGFRASSANLAAPDGAGRGLPTVKQLCDILGYTVNVTSIHRPNDTDGWGLFTVSISIPKSCFVLTDARDCDTSYRIKYA